VLGEEKSYNVVPGEGDIITTEEMLEMNSWYSFHVMVKNEVGAVESGTEYIGENLYITCN
jgi:hypothetical protein